MNHKATLEELIAIMDVVRKETEPLSVKIGEIEDAALTAAGWSRREYVLAASAYNKAHFSNNVTLAPDCKF